MSVWFCIPSKRPPEQADACFEAWRKMGYRIAVMREPPQVGGIANPGFEYSRRRPVLQRRAVCDRVAAEFVGNAV